MLPLGNAGIRPSARSLYESSRHLTKGLALLKTLSNTLEHRQQEFQRQIALGVSPAATKLTQ
jgi:hypothetical protein